MKVIRIILHFTPGIIMLWISSYAEQLATGSWMKGPVIMTSSILLIIFFGCALCKTFSFLRKENP